MSAGMLIEQAGLKGTRVGGAEVSERHANFIIADEGASAQDVLKLIDQVRSRVAERLGVELETEIDIW
jgi:UDP-N-acetylmuramate dehydrogenase